MDKLSPPAQRTPLTPRSRNQKESISFLKKRNKKLLLPATHPRPTPPQQTKVFWFFFSKKNPSFFFYVASNAAIAWRNASMPFSGRTITLNRVINPRSFHHIISTPFTTISPSLPSNSSTALPGACHSPT